MLTLLSSARSQDCGGTTRRDFLSAGTLGFGGALGLGSLSLPTLLAHRAAAGEQSFVRDKSVVLLFLSGGPTHIETFNPNMDAPDPYRSLTGEVQTTVPGLSFGGNFGRLAANARDMSVVRAFRHPIGGHVQAIKHVLNGGTDPLGTGTAGYSIGSAYANLRGANHPRTGMPTYCLLNSDEVDGQYRSERGRVEKGSAAGMLGSTFGPFSPDGRGDATANMRLNMAEPRLDDRRTLLRELDRHKAQVDADGGLDAIERQAFDLLLGSGADAFDLTKEDQRTFDRYDTSDTRVGKKAFRPSQLGRHFLTARRLIEAGCGFVTIHSAGWDMHADGNNPGIATGMPMLGGPVDKALSAFLEDLRERGMLDDVLIVVTGDFGRTPRINKNGGRDHWANLCTLALAGGGLNHGQIVGQSARNNDVPATEPYDPGNLMSTILHTLFDVGILRVTRGVNRQLLATIEGTEPIRELF